MAANHCHRARSGSLSARSPPEDQTPCALPGHAGKPRRMCPSLHARETGGPVHSRIRRNRRCSGCHRPLFLRFGRREGHIEVAQEIFAKRKVHLSQTSNLKLPAFVFFTTCSLKVYRNCKGKARSLSTKSYRNGQVAARTWGIRQITARSISWNTSSKPR